MSTTNDATAGSDCDVTYKILILGDSGVGKTSLIRALTGMEFSRNVISTVGIDFVKKIFPIDGVQVRLQIWDTAGQERFRSITKFQYRGTKGLVLVYDVANRQTFEMLNFWLNGIEKDFDQSGSLESIPVVVVGNKCDLEEERTVSTAEGQKIAERNVAAGFWETSAAECTNVKECFAYLAKIVLELYNPELMDTYKYSAAIDRAKTELFQRTLPIAIKPVEQKSVKLKKKRHRPRCECQKSQ